MGDFFSICKKKKLYMVKVVGVVFLTGKGNETLFSFDYIHISKYELNQQSLGTVSFLETVLYIRLPSLISLGWGEWGNPTTYYIVR